MTNSMIINNLEFALKQLRLSDSISVFELKRLYESLAINEEIAKKALVYYELSGGNKEFRYPSLNLSIKTSLPAICQRCLSEMTFNLDLNFNYIISNFSVEEDADNDEVDWLEEEKEMNLLELIEDELLLAMPIAPLHEVPCVKASMQSGEKPNPFALLKDKFK
jgi:uncharacterized protein